MHSSVIISLILGSAVLLTTINFSHGIAFRAFKNKLSANRNCSGETALAAFGCPCALVGQRCRAPGSICVGPGGSLIGNIGVGMPKRGICGCPSQSSLNSANNACIQAFFISFPFLQGTAGPCLFNLDPIPNLFVTATGGTPPDSYILAVVNSTLSRYSKIKLVDIDPQSGEVHVLNESPTAVVTQCYAVVGIDSTSTVSNTANFCVTINPADPNGICTCSPGTPGR